jgi:hypothetical protein
VLAMNVVALFVRLPVISITAAADSFHTPPVLIVISPLNALVPVVLVKLIVPVIDVFPFTVNENAPTVKILPLLIVNPAQVVPALKATVFAPVVAIITASVVVGNTPPCHVEAVPQLPPVVVLVIVAAQVFSPVKNSTASSNFVLKANTSFIIVCRSMNLVRGIKAMLVITLE